MPKRDEPWGWVVVAACFINCILYDGLMYSFGIMFVQILDAFKESKSFTAGISSLMHGMNIIAPLGGWFINKYGCRASIVVGGLLMSVGYIVSAWSNGVIYLYASIGLLAGTGLMLLDFAKNVAVVHYFDKRRSLAYGIIAFGSGLGSIIFNPISKFLIDTFGWRGTLLIEGGLGLNCAALGMLLRPVSFEKANKAVSVSRREMGSDEDDSEEQMELLTQNENKNSHTEDNNIGKEDMCQHKAPKENCSRKRKGNLKWSLLKRPPYLIYLLSGFCSGLAFPVPFTFIPDMALSEGYTLNHAVLLMTAVSIANTATRIPIGQAIHYKCISRTFLFGFVGVLIGINVAVMPFIPNYWALFANCLLLGFFCATKAVLSPLVSAELFTDALIADSRGFVIFVFGIGNLISGPIAGWIFDVTDSYRIAFTTFGSTFSIAGFLRIYLFILSRGRESLIDY